MIDTTGTVKDKYYTSSFGAPTSQTVSLNQRYRYTGKPFDEDGGIDLYYYGARYYDPMLGRFLAIDPLASKYPGWSPYVYTLDNPLKYVDPDGMTEEERIKAVQKAKEYVEKNTDAKGTTGYKFGAKGAPGECVDCSGLTSGAIKAAGVSDPAIEGTRGGVANTVENTTKVSTADVKPGNIVTFSDGKQQSNAHAGIVVGVIKDAQGNVTSVEMIQSGSSTGPTRTKFSTTGKTGYWEKRLEGFRSWDSPDPSHNVTLP